MPHYELIPHVGVPPVRLGMSPDEVRTAMGIEPLVPKRLAQYANGALLYHDSAFQVSFGEDLRVEYIELSGDPRLTVTYKGVDVFRTKADEILNLLARDAPWDPHEPEPGYCFTFPDLDLAAWRPTLPDDDDDPDGQYFATMEVGRPGYFRRQRA